ncbi:LysR family transcriptional regulator [Bosea sp. UC22_33]|uniref:LysR family transcriptional regulator n=1 Tax=Bosea sp. UC22_33 TaxID=3350165 RepID=UPI00366B118D
MLDSRRLTYFINACEKGSLTGGANASFVTQPVLTYHIAELEKTVGERLLHRRPDGVVPTDAGIVLLAHAKRVMEAMRATELAMRERKSQPTGSVTIGFLASIAPAVAPRIARECKERFPGIQLQLSEGTSLYLRKGVDDGSLDLAVNLRERGAASSQSILFEDLYVFARPNLIDLRKPTIALADVLQHRLLLPPRGHVVRELVEEAAEKHGLTIRIEAEVEGFPTLKSLIREAFAPGILGYGSIKSDVDDGRFQGAKIVKPTIQRELVLDEGANTRFPKVVAELRSIVTRAVRELAQ